MPFTTDDEVRFARELGLALGTTYRNHGLSQPLMEVAVLATNGEYGVCFEDSDFPEVFADEKSTIMTAFYDSFLEGKGGCSAPMCRCSSMPDPAEDSDNGGGEQEGP